MIGADQCPRCGSSHTASFIVRDAGVHAGCLDCNTLWEPFDPAELIDPDDPYSSFRDMCENCAFRPGSPERENKGDWDAMIADLRIRGRPFMCHKGTPISFEEGQSHDHPRNPDGSHDISRMRFCRGYLQLWGRDIRNMEVQQA